MVITRRRAFRRAGIRNLYRRSRLPRYGTRRRRIMRRFLNRRAVKPELKWETNTTTAAFAVASGTAQTKAITPIVIQSGTAVNQRIGSQIKLVKFDLRLLVQNDSSKIMPTAPTFQSGMCRVIIWTPRVRYQDAVAYMNSFTSNLTTIDINHVTVLMDRTVYLSPPYMAEATTADIAGGPYPWIKLITKKFMFPRKVHFARTVAAGDTVNDLDPDKDICYGTFLSAVQDHQISFETKLWYFDS